MKITPNVIPIANKCVSINITMYANTNPNRVEMIKYATDMTLLLNHPSELNINPTSVYDTAKVNTFTIMLPAIEVSGVIYCSVNNHVKNLIISANTPLQSNNSNTTLANKPDSFFIFDPQINYTF